eukprot:1155321-Amphidinium_carterae.2
MEIWWLARRSAPQASIAARAAQLQMTCSRTLHFNQKLTHVVIYVGTVASGIKWPLERLPAWSSEPSDFSIHRLVNGLPGRPLLKYG